MTQYSDSDKSKSYGENEFQCSETEKRPKNGQNSSKRILIQKIAIRAKTARNQTQILHFLREPKMFFWTNNE